MTNWIDRSRLELTHLSQKSRVSQGKAEMTDENNQENPATDQDQEEEKAEAHMETRDVGVTAADVQRKEEASKRSHGDFHHPVTEDKKATMTPTSTDQDKAAKTDTEVVPDHQ